MPVIINVPQDPTDLVIQGEQLRAASLSADIYAPPPPALIPLLAGYMAPASPTPTLPGEINYLTMVGGYPVPPREILLSQNSGTMFYNNAVLCTPCGAIYWVLFGQEVIEVFPQESAQRWIISGITKDSTGAALGGCRVIVCETGRLAKDGAAIVAETISDGSGNYSVEVPMNTVYQAIAYKPGSPDVAGITRNDLVPVAGG